MSLLEALGSQLGGSAISQLSQQLGTDDQTTGSAVSAALPVLLGALSRNAASPQGAQALSHALEKDHDGGILDDVAGFLGQGDANPGMGILKHVLGGNQQRVEQGVSKASGLDSAGAGKLMAMLAPIVLGQLGKQQRSQGLDVNGLASMLTNERNSFESASPAAAGLMGSLLDADGDGDVDISDIASRGAGLLGSLFGKR